VSITATPYETGVVLCPEIYWNNGAVTKRISIAANSLDGQNDRLYDLVIDMTSDGRYVVFSSYANNLVADDSNAVADVFMRDTQVDTTTLVSLRNNGTQNDANSRSASISEAGDRVGFVTASNTIVDDTGNSKTHFYVRSLSLPQTTRVSQSASGVIGNDHTSYGRLADGGGYAIFSSVATNLVTGDANAQLDAFVSGVVFVPPFIGSPGTLTASTNVATQINLSWAAIASADVYQVWRDSGDGGGSQLLATVNAAATTYTDNFSGAGLLCSNTAQYRVRGYRVAGSVTSAYTTVANGTTLPCVAPTLTAPATGTPSQGGLMLQWSTVTYTNNSYQLVISTDAAGNVPAAGYPQFINSNSHTVGPLPDGTYYWEVRATNTTINDYFGPFSAGRTFIVDTQPLTGVPTLLTPVSNNTVNTVRPTFTWSKVDGAAYYQLEINPTVNFAVASQFVSPAPGDAGAITTISYMLPESLPQGFYYWRVRAYDAAKNPGGYSTAVPAFKADLKKTPQRTRSLRWLVQHQPLLLRSPGREG
jgi:hypothetical protein